MVCGSLETDELWLPQYCGLMDFHDISTAKNQVIPAPKNCCHLFMDIIPPPPPPPLPGDTFNLY